MPREKSSEQGINAKNVSGDVCASNIVIKDAQVVNIYGTISPELETKKYEEKDTEYWEKEELVISIDDLQMIKGIIKNEEELKEALPIISLFKKFFNFLPKNHKGLFITAIQRKVREDKICKKITKSVAPNAYDEETIKLISTLEEEEEYSRDFSPEFYDDYRKIYNVIRSGDLDRKIIPHIEKLSQQNKDDELKEKFERYWYARLTNHPYAVFLDSHISERKLRAQIYDKFDNNEKELVRVYAKGEYRISFAGSICKNIAKKENYVLQENSSLIGAERHVEFIFVKN